MESKVVLLCLNFKIQEDDGSGFMSCGNMSVYQKPYWETKETLIVAPIHLFQQSWNSMQQDVQLYCVPCINQHVDLDPYTCTKKKSHFYSCGTALLLPFSFLLCCTHAIGLFPVSLTLTHTLLQTGSGPAESRLNSMEWDCNSHLHNLCLHTIVIRAAQ